MGAKRKTMPSKTNILEYWNPILIKLGLETNYELSGKLDLCFTCPEIGTQRAHIKPVCQGGNNSIKNLHNLCCQCHKESEIYEGQMYWRWFKYKRLEEFDSNKFFKRMLNKHKIIYKNE